MNTNDIIDLIKNFGEDTTLKQVLYSMTKYKCPKCNGRGKIKVEYNGYPKGFPDSGFVYEAAFKDIECDLCKGCGYTDKEYRPKFIQVQDGFEVVDK